MHKTTEEWILCAAIHIPDGKVHAQQPHNIGTGFVLTGRRHNNCYQALASVSGGTANEYLDKIKLPKDEWRDHQGFLTSNDRYVNRKEGWKIAKARGQILYGMKACDRGEGSILISENLYDDHDWGTEEEVNINFGEK